MPSPSEDEARLEVEAPPPPQRRALTLGDGLNLLARLWVIALLVFAAGFGGVGIYQYVQAQAELKALRTEPGSDAYAVVAYRRELEREIEAYRRDWGSETIPKPPPRPRLLEAIDAQRLQSRAPGDTNVKPTSPAAISAPR